MKKRFGPASPLGAFLPFPAFVCPVPGAQLFQTYENENM